MTPLSPQNLYQTTAKQGAILPPVSGLFLRLLTLEFATDVVKICGTALRGNACTLNKRTKNHIPRFIVQCLINHPCSSSLAVFRCKCLLAICHCLPVTDGVNRFDQWFYRFWFKVCCHHGRCSKGCWWFPWHLVVLALPCPRCPQTGWKLHPWIDAYSSPHHLCQWSIRSDGFAGVWIAVSLMVKPCWGRGTIPWIYQKDNGFVEYIWRG